MATINYYIPLQLNNNDILLFVLDQLLIGEEVYVPHIVPSKGEEDKGIYQIADPIC